MNASVFSPISATSAPEAVVRRLTEAIAAGSLRAGEKLPREDELAKTLGVAPMTLRQALASMRELNLVETTRGRNGGTHVRHDVLERLQEAVSAYPATAEQIRSLTDWRRAISGEACLLAAERGTEDEFRAIEAAADRFDEVYLEVAPRRVADARLHTLIAETAHSEHLVRAEFEIQERLSALILPLPNLASVIRGLPHSHDPIVTAIVARDGETARSAMIAHAETSFDWFIGQLELDQ
ncbi:MAG: bacterial regulatory s, gntR family protein [Mycobacterium sp.]|jgi:GntR family transcriptional repressor for pyruvate dehydrogenase complex|nr:bacterial regulatory s, gntR family protein [Mycobacterium sp.]